MSPPSHLDKPCPLCGTPRAFIDGGEIRKLRAQRGMSQRELAGRMEVSQSYLCDLEANRRTVTRQLWERIKKAVGEGKRG